MQGIKDTGGADKYQLKIHDGIERGSNETIKTGGVNMGGAINGVCCGGRTTAKA